MSPHQKEEGVVCDLGGFKEWYLHGRVGQPMVAYFRSCDGSQYSDRSIVERIRSVTGLAFIVYACW